MVLSQSPLPLLHRERAPRWYTQLHFGTSRSRLLGPPRLVLPCLRCRTREAKRKQRNPKAEAIGSDFASPSVYTLYEEAHRNLIHAYFHGQVRTRSHDSRVHAYPL